VAALANLELTPEELPAMGRDLNAILGYIAQLNELDVAQVAPMSQVSEIVAGITPDATRAESEETPLREDTPSRIRALRERWPKRIVALRIHEMAVTPETGGPIRNRDMKDPRMLACWQAVAAMGIRVSFSNCTGCSSMQITGAAELYGFS